MIAVLLALLLPALSRARESAKLSVTVGKPRPSPPVEVPATTGGSSYAVNAKVTKVRATGGKVLALSW